MVRTGGTWRHVIQVPTTRFEDVPTTTQCTPTGGCTPNSAVASHSVAHSVTAAEAPPRLCMEDRLLKGLLGESGFAALQQAKTVEEEDDDGFVWDFKPPSLRGGARSSTASTQYRQSMTSPSGMRKSSLEYTLLAR